MLINPNRCDHIKNLYVILNASLNVIVWLAVVFGINSVSNAGRKTVIV